MKNILLITVMLIGTVTLSQKIQTKVELVKFKTSAVCDQCTERIESELNYSKGVVYAELDDETKVLTVKYKTKFLNAEKIKYMVSKIGYDAGETPRDSVAFEKLPRCCKSKGFCDR